MNHHSPIGGRISAKRLTGWIGQERLSAELHIIRSFVEDLCLFGRRLAQLATKPDQSEAHARTRYHGCSIWPASNWHSIPEARPAEWVAFETANLSALWRALTHTQSELRASLATS